MFSELSTSTLLIQYFFCIFVVFVDSKCVIPLAAQRKNNCLGTGAENEVSRALRCEGVEGTE